MPLHLTISQNNLRSVQYLLSTRLLHVSSLPWFIAQEQRKFLLALVVVWEPFSLVHFTVRQMFRIVLFFSETIIAIALSWPLGMGNTCLWPRTSYIFLRLLPRTDCPSFQVCFRPGETELVWWTLEKLFSTYWRWRWHLPRPSLSGHMRMGSRSDSLRIWSLTFLAWKPVMWRMRQDSGGEGISLGSSGVRASLSWVAQVAGPAQPSFLTLSKCFLC